MAVVSDDKRHELFNDFKKACESMEGAFRTGLTNRAVCTVEGLEGDSIEILFNPYELSLSIIRSYGKMMTRMQIDGINSFTTMYPELGMKVECEDGSTIDISRSKINAVINSSC